MSTAIEVDEDTFAAALAASGVLLAADRLREPFADQLRTILGEAAPSSHPILRWTPSSDLSTLPDEALAHALAMAWTEVIGPRAGEFRIEVAFDWRRSDTGPQQLIDQLSRPSVGLASVYVEAQHTDDLARTEWTWPLNVGVLPGAGSHKLISALGESADATGFAEIGPLGSGHEECDLLLLPFGTRQAAEEVLKTPVRASCVLILGGGGDPWESTRSMLEDIESHTRASGFGIVPVPDAEWADWFETLVRELSQDAGLDIALRRSRPNAAPLLFTYRTLLERTRIQVTAAIIGRRLDRMGMPTRSIRRILLDDTGDEPPMRADFEEAEVASEDALSSMPFEEDPAAAVSVAAASRIAREEPAPERAPRFLQARVEEEHAGAPDRMLTAFRSHTAHHVVVRIGPEDMSWTEADVVFPDEVLPESHEPHRLRVVFTDLRLEREPQVGEISLPKEGASTETRFAVLSGAPGEHIEARIIVLHRNRVLQTVLLRGAVVDDPADADNVEPLRITTEVVARARLDDLSNRSQFDAAIVLNHTDEGLSRMTRIAGDRVDITEPDNIQGAVGKVLAKLEELVENPAEKIALESDEVTGLLVSLARQGRTFYDAIVLDQVGEEFAKADRIQVVAAVPEAYLPVEFVYDQVAPAEDAKLCPHAREVLAGTLSPDACKDHEGDRSIVCPLGFWGMTKVLERHVHTPKRANEVERDFLLLCEPTTGRTTLGPVGNAAFAASAKVDAFRQGISDEVVRNLKKSTAGKVERAKTWQKWVRDIRKLTPSLLVILPHTLTDDGIATMEVGKSAQLGAVDIAAEHIAASRDFKPIVLLLGCETGDPNLAFQHFPAAFRRNGAAIVLATLTKVLGRHAAPVADRIVTELVAQSKREEATFGDVMLAMRRALLLDGYPMVLALTSYGDADWRFGTAA